jgi:hypothetical protein
LVAQPIEAVTASISHVKTRPKDRFQQVAPRRPALARNLGPLMTMNVRVRRSSRFPKDAAAGKAEVPVSLFVHGEW